LTVALGHLTIVFQPIVRIAFACFFYCYFPSIENVQLLPKEKVEVYDLMSTGFET